jgi:hypothetical protein
MNFLSFNLFLKMIKGFEKRKSHSQHHMLALGHATWHADIIMMSAGVRLADVSSGPYGRPR